MSLAPLFSDSSFPLDLSGLYGSDPVVFDLDPALIRGAARPLAELDVALCSRAAIHVTANGVSRRLETA